MDVVAKTMTRVAQEILLKQNRISANVVSESSLQTQKHKQKVEEQTSITF